MLIGIGPGVTALQDYTNFIEVGSVGITAQQGQQNDTAKCTIRDRLNNINVTAEDDLIILDERDPNGWPSVNLLSNPSYEGTYSSGIAPGWFIGGGGSGITASSSATALYGSASQSLALANAANGATPNIFQTITLPTNENNTTLRAQPYYFTVSTKITQVFTNATANVHINWYTAPGGTLISSSASTTIAVGGLTGWVRSSCSGTAPSNATAANVVIGLTTSNATNSGTILMDGAQCEYATFGGVYVPGGAGTITALAANKYPTPYIDSTQPGCNVDRGISNCAFRQLRLYGGFIRHAKYNYDKSAEREIEIDAVDYGIMLAESPANLIISLNSLQTDAQAIATTFQYGQNQGFLVGIDYTTYVQTINTIDTMVFSWSTTKDVMNKIANQALAWYDVDYYKFLHYGPVLATSAPYGLSDHPNFSSTFPFYNFSIDFDSTESRTTPVIEGSTQLSSPATENQTGNGTQSTLTFNSGNAVVQVDSLKVNGITQTVGLFSVNDFTAYTALLEPDKAIMHFQNPPGEVLLNESTQTDFASGALTNVTSPTGGQPALVLTNFQQNWGGGALASQTLFGAGSPSETVTSGLLVISPAANHQAVSRLDGAPQLADFLFECDVTIPAQTGGTCDVGIVYRTTGWQNVDNTQAYILKINPSTVSLGRGTNTGSGAGTYTSITSQAPTGVTVTAGSAYHIRVYAVGSSHKIYISNVLQFTATDATYTSAGQIGLFADCGGTVNTSSLNNVNFIANTGNRVSVAKDLSTCGSYGGSTISWSATTTAFNSFTMQARISTNGGSTWGAWNTCTSGSAIPGFTANQSLSNNMVQLMETLSVNGTDTADAVAVPSLQSVTGNVTVNGSTQGTVPVVFIFRYAAPVTVRLHAPDVEYFRGAIRRRIHHHQKIDAIVSLNAAINRGNSDLGQFKKAQPIGNLRLLSPPCPTSTPLRPGTAIAITHSPSGLNQQLYQVQTVNTTFFGNNLIAYDLQLGYYRPDFAIMMATNQMDDLGATNTAIGTLINDVLFASDTITTTDSITSTVNNLAKYGGPGTWGGAFVYS